VNNATTLVLLTTTKKEGTCAPLSNMMYFPKFNGEHPWVCGATNVFIREDIYTEL
jgi:hypothetical protein